MSAIVSEVNKLPLQLAHEAMQRFVGQDIYNGSSRDQPRRRIAGEVIAALNAAAECGVFNRDAPDHPDRRAAARRMLEALKAACDAGVVEGELGCDPANPVRKDGGAA